MPSKMRFSLLLVLVMCITLIIGVATVSTAEENEVGEIKKSFEASPEQLNTIKELWGKDISKGEYLEKVFPEALKGMKPETIELHYNTPMVWPDKNTETTSDVNFSGAKSWGFIAHYSSSISNYLNQIYFSTDTMTYPATYCPYMDATSYLWRGSEGDLLVASRYEYDYNCYNLSAVGVYVAGTKGYYVTSGYHYVQAPSGQTPPYGIGTSRSNTIYVTW